MSAFEELGICPEIIRAIEEEGWTLPSAIQAEVIPAILTGRDVCAAAETGSGKTGAFGLPCAQIVHEALRNTGQISGGGGGGGGSSHPTTTTTTPLRFMPDVTDKDAQVLFTEDGHEIRSDNTARWLGVRCSPKILKGKYQFEVKILGQGLCRIGVSCEGSSLELGSDSKSWGFGSTGKKSCNRRFDDYGRHFGQGDIIGCLIDRENDNSITFSINGVILPVAFGFGVNDRTAVCPHICGKGFHVAVEDLDLQFPAKGFQPLGKIIPAHTQTGGGGWVEEAAGGGGASSSSGRTPLLLILEPTRDLAQQTFECIKQYSRYLYSPALKPLLCIGGAGERDSILALRKGIDIVVGTLRAVTQLSMKGDMNLSKLRFLVLDEADELIKNDERDFILKIKLRAQRDRAGGDASAVDPSEKVQMIFISATLYGEKIKNQVNRLCINPLWVDLKGRPQIPETLHAVSFEITPDLKLAGGSHLPPPPASLTDRVHTNYSSRDEELSQRVKILKPQVAIAIADKLKMTSCLIFCRTNLDCDNFENYLRLHLGGGFKGRAEKGKMSPYSCVVCAGQRDNASRQEALELFKEGSVRFLICTDVAARGIDISNLPFLIMMNIPDDLDQWFHRIGRVGRADAMGLAVTIHSSVKEKVWYHSNCKNRGAGCTNTNLVTHGGCCIWYDEPYLKKTLDEILTHDHTVQNPLFKMDTTNFTIPGLIDDLGSGSGSGGGGTTTTLQIDAKRFKTGDSGKKKDAATTLSQYGGQRRTDDSNDQQITLLATVEELSSLEKDLQLMFLRSYAPKAA